MPGVEQSMLSMYPCLQAEATALYQLSQLPNSDPETVLQYLLHYCTTAVVTLGAGGCCAGTQVGSLCSMSSRKLSGRLSRQQSSGHAAGQQECLQATTQLAQQPLHDTEQQHQDTSTCVGHNRQRVEIVHQPGVAGVEVVDVTGAGDMFAAG